MFETLSDLEQSQFECQSLRTQLEAGMQSELHLRDQLYKLAKEIQRLKHNNPSESDVDLGLHCDWLENQLEIVSQYEQTQANEIAELKEVIRNLFSNNASLYEIVKKLGFIEQREVDRA